MDASLVCRLCTTDLTKFPECYSIDEEMENLILMLTSISFRDVEDNLMLCITCYGRLKAFEDFRNKCIKNQSKFVKLFKVEVEEIVEDPEEEKIEEDYVEYIDEIEEDHFIEDDQEQYEIPDSDGDVIVTEEKIMQNDSDEIHQDELESSNKPAVVMYEETNPAERSKGRELYQRLLMQCDLCLKMIEKNRMEGHINKHNNIRPFKCTECNKSFYCKQLRRLHLTSIHTNVRIKCETCDKLFPSQRALYAHSLRHKNRDKYECELCEKKFNNTNSLKRHLSVHSGVRDFICGICGVGFYRKFNLDTHIKNVHEEIKNYVCTYESCQKKFGYARLLKDHIRKHHTKEFIGEF